MDEAEQTRVVRAGNLSAKTVNIVGPIENDFTIASEPVQSLSLQGQHPELRSFLTRERCKYRILDSEYVF